MTAKKDSLNRVPESDCSGGSTEKLEQRLTKQDCSDLIASGSKPSLKIDVPLTTLDQESITTSDSPHHGTSPLSRGKS